MGEDIIIDEIGKYDTGIHSNVTKITFKRQSFGRFFKNDRFPNLEELICHYNVMTELKLESVSLRYLDCQSNILARLKLNCPALRGLCCNHNNLTDDNLILNCPSLQELYCGNNNLSQYNFDFPSLILIDCSDNQLKELNINCPLLEDICCSHNKLTEINLKLAFLKSLQCDYNHLSKLELNCPSLLKLGIQFNKLTELELDCYFLETLMCEDNPLTDLNGLEFCEKLKHIYCSPDLYDSILFLKTALPNLSIVKRRIREGFMDAFFYEKIDE
jgi:Leucine-rich repeat (LRR) protein